MIVLDASAAVALLLDTPLSAATALRERIRRPGESLHVPHLIDLEVTQVLRRFVLRRELPAERARDALLDLADLPLLRYPHQPFVSRIWDLRENLTAYDACYVALAEVLDAPLLTLDAAMQRAAGPSATVEVV